MNKLYITLVFLFQCLIVHAQKLNVESFVAKTNDITARTQPRQDINGNDCALVKVQLAAPNAVYEGNVIGDVAYNTSEYLVYMAQGSKKMTVKLEGYLPLEIVFQDYDVKSLEPKTVYLLIISGVMNGKVQEPVRTRTGWIILDSEPSGASVYINDEFVGNTPLNNYKQAYGKYSYRLEHPNYHSSNGTIDLNSGRYEENIVMKPAFGSVVVKSNVDGAEVLLDGKATGKETPCTLGEVASGQHIITVRMDKYAPRQTSVVVEDGQTMSINISLDARFATISITSLKGAQIFCNGKQIGTMRAEEDMMEGYYDIEARLSHHKSVTKQIQVIAGQSQQITLNPIPIYGSLDIISTPRDADITIDGKSYGKTPFTIEQMLEGDHNIVLSKQGYSSFKKVVSISDGKTEIISATLTEGPIIQVNNEASSIMISGRLAEKDWKELREICKINNIRFVDLSNTDCNSIPDRAFWGDTCLTSIIFPSNVINIGYRAFYNSGLTSITIPNSVTNIGNEAFAFCKSLTSIDIPNSITNIGNKTFYNSGLTSITIPNSVTSLGNEAFAFCTSLTSIAIPNSVTIIGYAAFGACWSLHSITIPNSVTNIGEKAFSGCPITVYVPKGTLNRFDKDKIQAAVIIEK